MGFKSVCCEYVYYHWLITKLLWAYGSTEQSRVGIPSRYAYGRVMDDVGFPSICCEYLWLIKEQIWAYSKV